MNTGQANQKLTGMGWAIVKGVLHCPACEAKRKSTKVDNMAPKAKAPTEAPREPTFKQQVEIYQMLEVAYDKKAKRYADPKDTDKTLADDLGEGILWGWVARIREAEFGPDTYNQEVEALRAELARIKADQDRLAGELRKVGDEVEAAQKALRNVA